MSAATATRHRPRRPRYCVGIELPRELDGRSPAARRFKHLCRSFTDELGSDLLESDRQLIAQAAAMLLRAEQIRTTIISGDPVDGDEAVRLSSECRRILASLKAKAAKNKPAGPTLAEYLATRAAPPSSEESEGAQGS